MALIEIKASTPQPFDCPKCKDKLGYKVTQRIQTYTDLCYTADGENDGVVTSEYETVMYSLKRAICSNCNAKLPFNVRM